ncbi:MAG TPA: AAA family ATPase, partial [Longimicrobium sp.]|nr:AAA family ATPase [Longimicrobium sp.]
MSGTVARPAPAGATGLPFKGLEPFAEGDAAFFFSRDTERDVVLGSLMATRLLLLYGPSGVGKSSLVHAGLVHALREIARSNQEEGGVPELAVVVLDAWRDDPVRALKALLQGVSTQAADHQGHSAPDGGSLRDALAAAAARVQGEVYVVLDQFEEFFLYHGASDDESSFYQAFPRAVNDPSLTVRFLVSLREDALARLDLFKTAIPTLFANRYRLNYLKRAAAKTAIT